jgi:hypothetical protein
MKIFFKKSPTAEHLEKKNLHRKLRYKNQFRCSKYRFFLSNDFLSVFGKFYK